MARTIELLPVFLTGWNGTSDPWEDMEGHITNVDLDTNLIMVKWDHAAMAQYGPLSYGAQDMVLTTDRTGCEWLVLHIAI